jgi:hypothetical protein
LAVQSAAALAFGLKRASSPPQGAALPDQIQALVRAAAVPHHVPEAEHPVHATLPRDAENRLQRFEVRVYVGEEGGLHPVGRTS